jgi:hypothetical protein
LRLYTICTNDRPVLVMGAGVEPPMEDSLTTNAALMKAHRDLRAMEESLPADIQRISEVREIDEAIDTWLGEELQSFGLWDGDHAKLQVREADPSEAERWRVEIQNSIEAGDQDAGNDDFAVYLVSVTEETDE